MVASGEWGVAVRLYWRPLLQPIVSLNKRGHFKRGVSHGGEFMVGVLERRCIGGPARLGWVGGQPVWKGAGWLLSHHTPESALPPLTLDNIQHYHGTIELRGGLEGSRPPGDATTPTVSWTGAESLRPPSEAKSQRPGGGGSMFVAVVSSPINHATGGRDAMAVAPPATSGWHISGKAAGDLR